MMINVENSFLNTDIGHPVEKRDPRRAAKWIPTFVGMTKLLLFYLPPLTLVIPAKAGIHSAHQT
jgi:hypothetical protein